jgi:hypothetical protein
MPLEIHDDGSLFKICGRPLVREFRPHSVKSEMREHGKLATVMHGFSEKLSIGTPRVFLSKLGLGDGVLLLIISSKNKTENLRYQVEQIDNLSLVLKLEAKRRPWK